MSICERGTALITAYPCRSRYTTSKMYQKLGDLSFEVPTWRLDQSRRMIIVC